MVMPQQEALNLEVSRNSSNNDQKPLNMKRKPQEEESMSTTKRLLNDDERFSQRSGMPQAHIKLGSNRGKIPKRIYSLVRKGPSNERPNVPAYRITLHVLATL